MATFQVRLFKCRVNRHVPANTQMCQLDNTPHLREVAANNTDIALRAVRRMLVEEGLIVRSISFSENRTIHVVAWEGGAPQPVRDPQFIWKRPQAD